MHRITATLILLVGFGWSADGLAQQPKRLAPGVLKIIPANIDARDSFSLPMPLKGLESEKYSPNFAPVLDTVHGQSQNVIFFRDVWQYEFGFLGLRQVELPLPTDEGIKTKNVWYLVYRIRNTGKKRKL